MPLIKAWPGIFINGSGTQIELVLDGYSYPVHLFVDFLQHPYKSFNRVSLHFLTSLIARQVFTPQTVAGKLELGAKYEEFKKSMFSELERKGAVIPHASSNPSVVPERNPDTPRDKRRLGRVT